MRRKVLFISPSFSRGGAERNILNVINSLKESLFEVILIVLSNEISYMNLFERKVKVIVVESDTVFYSFFKLRKEIIRIEPEIIFSSIENLSIQLSVMKSLIRNKVILVSRIPTLPSNKLRNDLPLKFRVKSYIISKLFFLLKRSDYIISQTLQMKEEIGRLVNIPQHRSLVIRNTININQVIGLSKCFNPFELSKSLNIVAVGALYPAKGFDVLIKALGDFNKDNSRLNFHLHILGEDKLVPEYREYLTSLAKDYNISNNISFLGHVNNPFPYIKNADLFVLSSIKEGFPNVVLESLLLGTYVIVTDCVDFRGIVNGVNGKIIKKGDVQELLRELREFNPSKVNINTKLDNFNYNNWFIEILG